MSKFNADGFRIHKGTIQVFHITSYGYDVVRVVLNSSAREYTRAAATSLNQRYHDVDYTQFIGTIETGTRNNEVVVDFQVYDAESKTYCEPRVSISTTRIPMELLRVVDKTEFIDPDRFVDELINKGFTLLKDEYRQVKYSNGKVTLTRYQVKDARAVEALCS